MTTNKTAVVVGAGIVGIAAARALAEQGFTVHVFEKSEAAMGASVRNFGMVWPIGQPAGALYDRAMRSRQLWQQLAEGAGIWYTANGALQLARETDELQVIEEFMMRDGQQRNCRMLTPEEAVSVSPRLRREGLLGAMFSPNELTVDPREAIAKLPGYLSEQYPVTFHFGTAVTAIDYPQVYCGTQQYQADKVIICGGQEFETLYPEVYRRSGLTRCKLQMMRSEVMPGLSGPSVCGGLTLGHYTSFAACPSLPALKQRFAAQYPEYVRWGIHVMMSRNGLNKLVIGDSHEYGQSHDPFDKAVLNRLILDYLHGFAELPDLRIQQSWNGTYLKSTEGKTELVAEPEPNVVIVNGLSGAGMTLSFGLLEEIVAGF